MSLQLLICGMLCFHSSAVVDVWKEGSKVFCPPYPPKINQTCPNLGAVVGKGEAKGFSLRQRVCREKRA